MHAAVEAKPDAALDPEEIMAFVKRELGSVKTPKVVHVFASMPKSPVGKVLKTSLRDKILKQ